MIPFDDALGQTLRDMGLAEPATMLDLRREWDDLAGEPWSSQATPLYIRSGVLVVEAGTPSGVSFLRYGVSELQKRLARRFGPGMITAVEIRSPGRRPGSRR